MRLTGLICLAPLLVFLGPGSRAADITEIFDAVPGGTVLLKADAAAIAVQGTDPAKAVFQIRRGEDDAESIESKYLIDFSIENGVIRASVKRPKEIARAFSRPLSIAISLPRDLNIDLESSGGHIHVTNLDGSIAIRTSGGAVTIRPL